MTMCHLKAYNLVGVDSQDPIPDSQATVMFQFCFAQIDLVEHLSDQVAVHLKLILFTWVAFCG